MEFPLMLRLASVICLMFFTMTAGFAVDYNIDSVSHREYHRAVPKATVDGCRMRIAPELFNASPVSNEEIAVSKDDCSAPALKVRVDNGEAQLVLLKGNNKDLSQLTRADAQQLLGTGVTDGNVCHYALIGKKGSFPHDKVYFEVEFSPTGMLQRYRVVSSLVKSSQWQTVKKGEERRSSP